MNISTGLKLSESTKFNDDIDLNETILLPYSSGTTGLPKGVMHSHNSLVGTSEILNPPMFHEPIIRPTTNDSQDVLPAFLPFFHIYGLSIILVNKLALGCKLLSMKYEINHFLDSIVKQRATILPLVPPIVIQLGNHPASKHEHFENVRTIMSGAACLANSDAERFMKMYVL